MAEHEREDWYRIYSRAMLELEQAKMAGWIADARNEIAARIEKLREMPGLHDLERQAIDDALNSLRVLEREVERAKADERRIAEEALEKLRTIEPKFKD